MSQTDLIVVGAGSAGCVMASRLAYQHGFHVTLVEPPSTKAPAIDRQRYQDLRILQSFQREFHRSKAQRVGLSSAAVLSAWFLGHLFIRPLGEEDLARLAVPAPVCSIWPDADQCAPHGVEEINH